MWMLAINLMITRLQSIDPERLGIKKGSGEYTWIFLGGGTKNFMGLLGVGRDGNRRIKLGREIELREGILGETAEIEEHLRDDMDT